MKQKYGARKTVCPEGHHHPSGLEAAVCIILHLRQKAKEIVDLKWIAPVDLEYEIAGKKFRKRWKVDFSFTEVRSNTPMWAEAKGVETADYKLRRQLWNQGAGPGPCEIWKGGYGNPKIVEILIPGSAKK